MSAAELASGGALRPLRIHGRRGVRAQGPRGGRVRRVPDAMSTARKAEELANRAGAIAVRGWQRRAAGATRRPEDAERRAGRGHRGAAARDGPPEGARGCRMRWTSSARSRARASLCLGCFGVVAEGSATSGFPARSAGSAAAPARLHVEAEQVREVRAVAREAREKAPASARRASWRWPRPTSIYRAGAGAGRYFRARDHMDIADDNARGPTACALRMRCPTAPGDRDHDGIPDDVDKCPTSPRTRTASRTRTAAPTSTTTRTASPTQTTSARTSPRTRTASRTRTAAPTRTTTTTASRTRRQVPERARGQGRLRGRRRLPRSGQRQGRRPRRRRQVPERPGSAGQRRLPEEVQAVVVTREKIELKQKIFFDTGKATIKARSFPLLDEIAAC